MATKTIRTYEHSCDLCGLECNEDELAQLFGPVTFPSRQGQRLDVCGNCRTRPIADALAFLARTTSNE